MASKIERSKEPVNINLYIPEIGDKIVLTEDWTFDMYYESRNDIFFESIMDHPLFERDAVTKTAYDILRKSNINPDEIYYGETRLNRLVYDLSDANIHWKLAKGFITVDGSLTKFPVDQQFYDRIRPKMTIPAGTAIFVDRVYIRKGAADFSSITFRVEKFPADKSSRFWVKLSDSRKIVGDMYSRIV